MKKKILTLCIIMLLNVVGYTAFAQNNIGAKADYVDKDVVNLEQQYKSRLAQKKDGKFDLYTYGDGTKITLTMKSGAAYGLAVLDKNGTPQPVTMMKKKIICHVVSKDANGNIHVFTVGCGKDIEGFIGKL